jgi:hypothetical protein
VCSDDNCSEFEGKLESGKEEIPWGANTEDKEEGEEGEETGEEEMGSTAGWMVKVVSVLCETAVVAPSVLCETAGVLELISVSGSSLAPQGSLGLEGGAEDDKGVLRFSMAWPTSLPSLSGHRSKEKLDVFCFSSTSS